ncbi:MULTISPECIES: transposase [Mesorhizobium]|uniref:transposase n=1 Tax=Mesorhizobium TaxID=68287 RepID=UPI001FECE38A|nr:MULTISPECIES: transposase [Mesorhizobium]
MPGIGPVTALTYRATIDHPKRFRRTRSVGAYLGLTPRRYQSGEVDRVGRITKVGDSETRTALFEAANVILRLRTQWSSMKAWPMKIAKSTGCRSPWPNEWQSPFTACGLTNRISVGRQLRLSCPRNSERSMQGAIRTSSHDLWLPVPEHAEDL